MTNAVFIMHLQSLIIKILKRALKAKNLIVRIFAVLDRRVGKRRLKIMKETIMEEPDTFREFYAIRVKAEGML